ncbi:RacP protein [Streptomyces massasporeus]
MPRASERRSAASQRHADTVRFVLFEARPAGLAFNQLVRSSELSPHQARAGLACLRDIIAERGWPPLIWTRKDGYQFCTDPAETVSLPKDAVGFVILPRRWVVERSLAWIMHARRHARDYERLIQHSESLITWAAITLMTRRITRRQSRRTGQPTSRENDKD